MISIISERCRTVQTNGVGRHIAQNGNTQFVCGACEEKLLFAAVKTVRPKAIKRAPGTTNGSDETLVARD